MSNNQTILLILAYFAIGGMVVSFIDTAFEPNWRGGITGRVLAVATWPMVVLVTIGHVAGAWVRNRIDQNK